jgi:hypothetical protein
MKARFHKPVICGYLCRWITLIFYLSLLAGCQRSNEASINESNITNVASKKQAIPKEGELSDEEYQRKKEAALAGVVKIREEIVRNPQTNVMPLPNWVSGPGHPRPMGMNFYEIEEQYPDYVICTYDISEKHYDRTNEREWFEAAILQIRGVGKQRFPPVKWFAIVILNRAEFVDRNTIDQSYKVGTILKANQVFDIQQDPMRLVDQAEMDRRPFKVDPNTQQDRWINVERHAATNQITKLSPSQ